MRVLDRPLPAVTGPRPPASRPIPHRLWITVERVAVDVYTWDDFTATWDDPEADYLWDASPVIGSQRIDATCDFQGLVIDYPEPDAVPVFPAASLAMTLANGDGQWSAYDQAGRLVDYLPGRAVDVWATTDDGEPWWLFSGEITRWAETAAGTVDVEAFDIFGRLNTQIGTWQPGTPGQRPADRLEAICALIGFDGPRRFDPGDVTLLAPPSDRTPLEEAQRVAVSDGGVLVVDTDGTLLYRDRTWPGGRPDQTDIPVVGTNVCTAPVVAWDPELVTDDEFLVNVAVLGNVAEPPVVVDVRNQDSMDLYGPRTLPGARTEDLWTTALEATRLAEYLTTRRADARLRVGQLLLYLHDPRQDLWPVGLDRRRGDIVELLHEQPAAGGPQVLDVFAVISAIRHDITPSTWVTTWATTRTVGNRVTERWDQSAYTWDDPNVDNVWGH